ncbi:hypothetical protein K2173_019981 [Erythroxylum novogranatense]|uniref:NAC domain-containing protein n=1 Tax=Erythroxylum novogranatense TaxID=1862640 RepID=A0AAV8U6N4_9ROSI|nr:hypothetical protein K2173_019981 [Erythroxylum novogranatense]
MNLPLPPEFKQIPGYRFNPTDTELVEDYLKRKVLCCPRPLDMIPILDDVYSYSPFQLLLNNSGVMDGDTWIFFSQRKTGINIAKEGYYQVCTEREVKSINEVIGFVQTSIFYCGEPPNGYITDWILEEFRLNPNAVYGRETNHITQKRIQNIVVCKIFRDLQSSDTECDSPLSDIECDLPLSDTE